MFCGNTHICKKKIQSCKKFTPIDLFWGDESLRAFGGDPKRPLGSASGHKGGASATWHVTSRTAITRELGYSACLKLNRFAGCKPRQLNQAGPCTKRPGEPNDTGFVAHRRVVPCCFFMFFKKLSRFVLAAEAFLQSKKRCICISKIII